MAHVIIMESSLSFLGLGVQPPAVSWGGMVADPLQALAKMIASCTDAKGRMLIPGIYKDVEKPAAVRYDWANNPQGNLYNKAGLPTAPFRTDDWPATTLNNK